MADEGLVGVRWSLDLVIELSPTSWTFENVSDDQRQVVGLLDEYRGRFPDLVDFDVFDFEQYGCPAVRRRVLAGSPRLIERMRDEDGSHDLKRDAPSVKHFFESESWPAGSGELSTNLVVGNNPRVARRVENGIAYTVTSKGLRFSRKVVDVNGVEHGRYKNEHTFTTLELARFQTFPASYQWPGGTQKQLFKAVGNAVPCTIAHLLLGGTHATAIEAGLSNGAFGGMQAPEGPDDTIVVSEGGIDEQPNNGEGAEQPMDEEEMDVEQPRPLVIDTPIERLKQMASGVDLSEWAFASERLVLEPRHSSTRASTAAREVGTHMAPTGVDFGWHSTRGADRNCDINGVAYSCVLTIRTRATPTIIASQDLAPTPKCTGSEELLPIR